MCLTSNNPTDVKNINYINEQTNKACESKNYHICSHKFACAKEQRITGLVGIWGDYPVFSPVFSRTEQRLRVWLAGLHHLPQWWPMPPGRWSCWKEKLQCRPQAAGSAWNFLLGWGQVADLPAKAVPRWRTSCTRWLRCGRQWEGCITPERLKWS